MGVQVTLSIRVSIVTVKREGTVLSMAWWYMPLIPSLRNQRAHTHTHTHTEKEKGGEDGVRDKYTDEDREIIGFKFQLCHLIKAVALIKLTAPQVC